MPMTGDYDAQKKTDDVKCFISLCALNRTEIKQLEVTFLTVTYVLESVKIRNTLQFDSSTETYVSRIRKL